MIELVLKRRVPDGNAPNNLALYGVPVGDTTESVRANVYWKDDDDPDMEPQYLGSQTAGHSLVVPFDISQGRNFRFFVISQTADGQYSARRVQEGQQATFGPPESPTLRNVEYVADASVEVTYDTNGSTAPVNIWRSVDGEPYAIIDTDTPGANPNVYTDTDAGVDGSYSYYLTQDGIAGESNILADTVSGEGGGAGTPPSGLDATLDGDDVDLSWTNNSGTGLNYIERRINPTGSWITIGSVSSGTAAYTDTTVVPRPFSQTYYYRVRNASAIGYSNEAQITIDAE